MGVITNQFAVMVAVENDHLSFLRLFHCESVHTIFVSAMSIAQAVFYS